MKIKKYNTEQQWLEGRKGLIGGSTLHDVYSRSSAKKIGFYQLIADRLGLDDGSVDGRERGHDMEKEAVQKLSEATGIKFIHSDYETWVSDENPSIAFSPDGYTKNMKIVAEIKNLGSARHLQAIIENKIPGEYYEQAMQAFIVNEKLEKLYFTFYDNRIIAKPLHYIVLTREQVEDTIKMYMDYEINILDEVNTWVEKLAF